MWKDSSCGVKQGFVRYIMTLAFVSPLNLPQSYQQRSSHSLSHLFFLCCYECPPVRRRNELNIRVFVRGRGVCVCVRERRKPAGKVQSQVKALSRGVWTRIAWVWPLSCSLLYPSFNKRFLLFHSHCLHLLFQMGRTN